MQVTKHAEKRLKERCGWNARSFQNIAGKIMNEGLKSANCAGRLKKYMNYLYLSHRKANNIRIYGNHVYVINGSTLITVLEISKAHKTAAKQQTKKNREGVALMKYTCPKPVMLKAGGFPTEVNADDQRDAKIKMCHCPSMNREVCGGPIADTEQVVKVSPGQ